MNDILFSLPWRVVFGFLGGEDVARALMAGKDSCPWKMGSEDPLQCVVSALNERLVATDVGKELLAKSNVEDSPTCLPKLLYSVDSGYYLRYDGLYCLSSAWPYYKRYLRFYPSGEVSVFGSDETPEQLWNSLRRAPPFIHHRCTYSCNWIHSGREFWELSFEFGTGGSYSAFVSTGALVLTEFRGGAIRQPVSSKWLLKFVQLG